MLLNIRLEHAVRRPLRVADIVPKLGTLAANFALGHRYHLTVGSEPGDDTTRAGLMQLFGLAGLGIDGKSQHPRRLS